MAEPAPTAMFEHICAAVHAALLAGGETRVHVTIAREVEREAATVSTEFVNVEGFACGSEKCDKPFHVRIWAQGGGFEYPDHFNHGGPGGG